MTLETHWNTLKNIETPTWRFLPTQALAQPLHTWHKALPATHWEGLQQLQGSAHRRRLGSLPLCLCCGFGCDLFDFVWTCTIAQDSIVSRRFNRYFSIKQSSTDFAFEHFTGRHQHKKTWTVLRFKVEIRRCFIKSVSKSHPSFHFPRMSGCIGLFMPSCRLRNSAPRGRWAQAISKQNTAEAGSLWMDTCDEICTARTS